MIGSVSVHQSPECLLIYLFVRVMIFITKGMKGTNLRVGLFGTCYAPTTHTTSVNFAESFR